MDAKSMGNIGRYLNVRPIYRVYCYLPISSIETTFWTWNQVKNENYFHVLKLSFWFCDHQLQWDGDTSLNLFCSCSYDQVTCSLLWVNMCLLLVNYTVNHKIFWFVFNILAYCIYSIKCRPPPSNFFFTPSLTFQNCNARR